MDKSIKYFISLAIFSALLLFLYCNNSSLNRSNDYTHVFAIEKLDKPYVGKFQNNCLGWQKRSSFIIENTANDSIRIRDKIIAPGQIGKLYSMDIYDDKDSIEYHYWPYKATSGRLVIKIVVSNCDAR